MVELHVLCERFIMTANMVKGLVSCAAKTLEVLKIRLGKENAGSFLEELKSLMESCEVLRVADIETCVPELYSPLCWLFESLSASEVEYIVY